jgi:hypothetical protein
MKIFVENWIQITLKKSGPRNKSGKNSKEIGHRKLIIPMVLCLMVCEEYWPILRRLASSGC